MTLHVQILKTKHLGAFMKLCVASKSLGIENKKTDKRTAQNSEAQG